MVHVADDICVDIEPKGHNEQVEPFYEFYVSKTQETNTLAEAEVKAEIDRLKNSNR